MTNQSAQPTAVRCGGIIAETKGEIVNEEDYEYFAVIDGFHVGVNKVGGGTVGESYAMEDWKVTVMNGPIFIYDRDLLHCGSPATHARIAQMASDFASEEDDL